VHRGSSDVLVIGAGPAGCAAAITLAQGGADVCIVDRATFPRAKTCGDALSNGCTEHLRDFGVLDEMLAGPHAVVREGVAVLPDGSRIQREFHDPGYIVERRIFDDILRRRVEALGGRVIQGTIARELLEEDGAVCGATGPCLDWRARVVIAADGYGSVAWHALGRPKPRDRYLAVSSTAYYEGIAFPHGPEVSDHYFEHDLPCGYAWIFPAIEGRTNVGVIIRSDTYAASPSTLVELLAAFEARHPERFSAARRCGPVRTWSLPTGKAPWPPTAPGLLLAGDAGNFIDPLSGEGIWQALYTGRAAAQVSAEALARSGRLEDADRRRYEQACDRHFAASYRTKAAIQLGIRWILEYRLYRSRLVRAALQWGYARDSVETTKHV
jgi:geranylgeranyl reductase family protein